LIQTLDGEMVVQGRSDPIDHEISVNDMENDVTCLGDMFYRGE
jgi:hypothetical protein